MDKSNYIDNEYSYGFFCFNISQFPLILLTIEGSPQSMEEMNLFLKAWEELYKEAEVTNKPYKLVFDVREGVLSIKDLLYLRRLGMWLIEVQEKTKKHMDRTAIIVKSDIIQKFLYLVFKVYKPIRPFKLFRSLDGVKEWIWSQAPGDKVEDMEPEEMSPQENTIENQNPYNTFYN